MKIKKYNIIIADDHKMFLDGLLSIFEQEEAYHVLFTAKNGLNVIKYLDINSPKEVDLVITDLTMPDMTGIELNKAIKEKYPEVKTLVVSMHNDANMINELMDDNVDGFVPKNSEKQELLHAIRTLLDGGKFFSESIKRTYFEKMLENKKNKTFKLTDREQEVLKLIAEEFTTQEIADQLSLSRHTIESYRKTLFSKLNARNLAGLAKHAMRLGLIK